MCQYHNGDVYLLRYTVYTKQPWRGGIWRVNTAQVSIEHSSRNVNMRKIKIHNMNRTHTI